MTTALREAHARLLANLPLVADLETHYAHDEITSEINLNFGGTLWFTLFADRLTVDIENVRGVDDYEFDGAPDDPVAFATLHAAMTAMESLPQNDEWDATSEYGYADATVLGTETWEDQKQLESIKRMKGIPDHWFLTKCRNFDGRKLQDMQTWLQSNCQADYKRIGWATGCSTTVGIAFESANDAFFYKLRWR